MLSLDCKRRLRMRLPPPTSAMMRARRMIDTMTCTERSAAPMGHRHGARRRCLWPMRQEPFCLAIALEDGQTKYIFECRANIVANGPHKRADQSQTKRTKGWQKFRHGKIALCLLFQTADAPARGRVNQGCQGGRKFRREKIAHCSGTKLPMLHQEAESSNHDCSDR